MFGDFNAFISLLSSGNQEAWKILRFEMEQIIEHHCKEGLVEMLWISHDTIIPENKTQFFEELFFIFKETYRRSKPTFNSFKEFKFYILNISDLYIAHGFKQFMLLLPQNHARAWWRLDKDLKYKMIYWLISEKHSHSQEAEELYFDALATFTKAIKQKGLDFQTSRNLKSYIFKIAEFKVYEANRGNRKQFRMSNFEIHQPHAFIDELYDETIDSEIEYLIAQLEEQEREILINHYFHQENLKMIAHKLMITEENCRVIKFRALRKMKKIAIVRNTPK